MRIEEYRFELLNNAGLLIGALDGVELGGRITGNVNANIRWSCTLTYRGNIVKEQWYKYRIRIIAVIDGKEHPLGVFVVRGGEENFTPLGGKLALDLYDQTFIPASDAVENTYTVERGTNIDSAIRTLLESSGATGFAIDSTNAVVPSTMVWEPGTSKLRIANDLLASAGFMALWCDYTGAYRLSPHVPPRQRPVVYEFKPSQKAMHLPDWVRVQDARIPNKIICVSQESSGQPAMRAVAVNEDPDSPYSFQNQGQWVTEVHVGVEASSQAVLDAAAMRYLARAVSSATVKRHMAVLPIELNAVCANSEGGREVVENIDITLSPGSLMTITTREVA